MTLPAGPVDPQELPQELALMELIRDEWGPAIAKASIGSGIPDDFLAALIANESGGKPGAWRFEPGVLVSLWNVLEGRAVSFGSIVRSDLMKHLSIAPPAGKAAPPWLPIPSALNRLDALSTSWGLTQIMGWNLLDRYLTGVPGDVPAMLQNPASNLAYAVRLLAEFAHQYKIDLAPGVASGLTAGSAGQLFDCWNTGKAHGRTSDPQYIPQGLLRIALYNELPSPPPSAVSA